MMLNSQQSNKRKANEGDDFDFDIMGLRFGREEEVQDELQRYLSDPKATSSTQAFDVIAWWKANEIYI